MSTPADPHQLLFEAVSFAARAHEHQKRKDGRTPYAAHTFRVCLVIRHFFGIDDPKVLTAALLHDTIEDTPTDYDDLADLFGAEVAGWVATLTKDMRMEESAREEAYHEALVAAPWQVVVCKLADMYDNINDSAALPPEKRARTLGRIAAYLDALRPRIPELARTAYQVTSQRLRRANAAEPKP